MRGLKLLLANVVYFDVTQSGKKDGYLSMAMEDMQANVPLFNQYGSTYIP